MAVFVFFCFGEHLLVTRCTQNCSLGNNFHFLVLFCLLAIIRLDIIFNKKERLVWHQGEKKRSFCAALNTKINQKRLSFHKCLLKLWLKILERYDTERQRKRVMIVVCPLTAWHSSIEKKNPVLSSSSPLLSPPSYLLNFSPFTLLCLSPCFADTFIKWFDFSFMQPLLKSNKQSIVGKERWPDKDFRLTPTPHDGDS